MPRPSTDDYASFYHKYVELVAADSVDEMTNKYSEELKKFFSILPEAKADFAYDKQKWTVKELLQHVTDTERIFSYRALCISRKDTTPLPSFDENLYAMNCNAKQRMLSEIKNEFNAVRTATDLLLKSFSQQQLSEKGTASNNPVSVNAIAFIIYGHLLHHKKVLIEKYRIG